MFQKYPKVCSLYCTSCCDNGCKHCLVRSPYPGDADFDKTLKNLTEFKQLGGVYVDLTGGNPLLVPWLPEILSECKKLKLYTSLTISGPRIVTASPEVFQMPSLLRFSIDGDEDFHNANRGKGYFDYVREGLKIAGKLRNSKNTQLIFTIVPGEKGNIDREQFASVLQLARENQVLVNVNPLFNIKKMSKTELSDLRWFAKQADVQMSRGKLRFVLRGGNNHCNATCKAISSVATISSDNNLVLPCYHNPQAKISLDDGLKKALDSEKRLSLLEKEGSLEFCHGCSIWCYVVPSFIYHVLDRVVVWEHALSGFQAVRDSALKAAGKCHLGLPYPYFEY